MTNATIQNLMSVPPVYTEGNDSGYRQYNYPVEQFNVYGGFGYWLNTTGSYALEIWHEAQRLDVLTDAYADNAEWLAPVLDLTVVPLDQDTEAALRQAELLGASVDQRAKLRAIVTARITAESHALELGRQLVVAQQALTVAQTEPITDPSDKLVWGIFGDAAKESKRQGYCSVYDQISEAVGIPTRDTLNEAGYMDPSRYDVEVEVTFTQRVTVTVDADSYDAAIRAGDDMSHRDIWDYLSIDSLSHYDISDTDAKDAEEASE